MFRLDADGLCVFGCGGRAPRFGQEGSPEQGHRPDCTLVRLVKEIRRLRAGQFYAMEDEAPGEPQEMMTPLAMIEEIRRLRTVESEMRNLIANETGGQIDVVDEETHEDASVPELLTRLLGELRSEEWLMQGRRRSQVHRGGLAETVRATLVLGILRRHGAARRKPWSQRAGWVFRYSSRYRMASSKASAGTTAPRSG